MVDPDSSRSGLAAAASHDASEALVASRRALRDLAALLALPAMWVNDDPDAIAAGLLGVLFAMLRLESAYVRFDDPAGGRPLERWRPHGQRVPIELASVLDTAPDRVRGAVTVSVAHPSGAGAVRVTAMASVFPGEDGLVLVGCRRLDFPTDLELHLLRIAVGQATVSLHTERRLASERAARVRAEAALQRRNAFLETLAQDLRLPLATLTERAAQAHAFAIGADHAPALASVETQPGTDASAASTPRASESFPASPAQLTRREAEVLGLLAQGLSNKEIAAVLWLSERTIERHITNLYRKIAVQRRSEATAFALRHGLVARG
jgi:DNA-binding NarL/FixJ family response regulator